MRFAILVALGCMAVSQPALAHKLIPQGKPVEVAKSTLTVTPTTDWNRLSQRPGRVAETWTLDGDELNDLTFYGGVEDNKTLFREVDKKNRPLPRFASDMLLADIPALVEASYRIARGTTIFNITVMEPTQFAGHKGIRFSYEFVGGDDVRRKGEADAAIVQGRLYMTSFEAPALHFFDQSIEEYRALRSTIAL